jgi:acyl-coenzyme A synthetase/AMP-(fatty) acid ligase
VKAVLSVGAPLAPTTAAALADWFGVEIVDVYGSTEGDVVYFHQWHAESEAGAEVYPTTEIEIVGPDHAVQPAGESGYVRVRTAAMASGYLGADDADPFHGFHDGWFYPGDLGVLDGRRLTLVGRDDELLNIGGQKILAPRLEAAVMTVPGVREAAAVAVPDALGVPQLSLAIVAESAVTRSSLAGALAPHANGVPLATVLVIARMPRTESGKIRRTELTELIRQRGLRG